MLNLKLMLLFGLLVTLLCCGALVVAIHDNRVDLIIWYTVLVAINCRMDWQNFKTYKEAQYE